MKVALLLTGQPRSHKLCRNNIKSVLIDKYDTDVFMAINTTGHTSNTAGQRDIDDLIKFYNPRDSIILDSYNNIFKKDISKFDDSIIDILPVIRLKILCEQFYVVKKAYELLLNYVTQTGTKYDIVIRTRFDTLILESDLKDQIDNMKIYSHFGDFDESVIDDIKEISKDTDLNLYIPKSNEICVEDWKIVNSKLEYANDFIWSHSFDLSPIMYEYYDEIFNIVNEMAKTGLSMLNTAYYEIFFGRFIESHNFKLVKNEFKVKIIR
jgi:hypothetical protein